MPTFAPYWFPRARGQPQSWETSLYKKSSGPPALVFLFCSLHLLHSLPFLRAVSAFVFNSTHAYSRIDMAIIEHNGQATALPPLNNVEDKGPQTAELPSRNYESAPVTSIFGKKSPGVQRVEAISEHFRLSDRILFFIGIFLVAYAYGLDGTIRYTYQVGSLHQTVL